MDCTWVAGFESTTTTFSRYLLSQSPTAVCSSQCSALVVGVVCLSQDAICILRQPHHFQKFHATPSCFLQLGCLHMSVCGCFQRFSYHANPRGKYVYMCGWGRLSVPSYFSLKQRLSSEGHSSSDRLKNSIGFSKLHVSTTVKDGGR